MYEALCDGRTDKVEAHPGVDALHSELISLHPEPGDVSEEQRTDFALCPWSYEFDRSPGHLIVSCVWPKADYVGNLLKKLALKHGLAFYDPQSDKVTYP